MGRDGAGELLLSSPPPPLGTGSTPAEHGSIRRGLTGCDQGQSDDVLCAWQGPRDRACGPASAGRCNWQGKALRGAAPGGGHAPMLLSGIWDDGTLPPSYPGGHRKTNEIPVFRQLLGRITRKRTWKIAMINQEPDAHAARARPEDRASSRFIFTIGENQPRLFDAVGQLPDGSTARPGPWTGATAASTCHSSPRPCRRRSGSWPGGRT